MHKHKQLHLMRQDLRAPQAAECMLEVLSSSDIALCQNCSVSPSACFVGPAEEDVVEQVLDVIMLRLRTSDGLQLSNFQQSYGERFAEALLRVLQRHEEAGLVSRIHGAGDSVVGYRLTDPEGFLLSNDVMSDCFAAVQKAAVAT